MFCTKCSDIPSFSTAKDLILHLQSKHHQTTFICNQDGCTQIFQNVKSFEKHLNSHLGRISNIMNPTEKRVVCSDDCLSKIQQNVLRKRDLKSKLDIQSTQHEFSQLTTHFLTNFHSKNHFTREDVNLIKDEVTGLMQSLYKILGNFSNIIPDEQKTDFEIVRQMIENPFCNKISSLLLDSNIHM